MSGRADKFFHFTMMNKGHTTNVAVWNGIKDYSNLPDRLLQGCWGRVVVKQISTADGCARLVLDLAPSAEFLILWTRDDNLYRPAVDALKLMATHKRNPDGSISSERIGTPQ